MLLTSSSIDVKLFKLSQKTRLADDYSYQNKYVWLKEKIIWLLIVFYWVQ